MARDVLGELERGREVDSIVGHGRSLIALAVRLSWQHRSLPSNPEYAVAEIEALVREAEDIPGTGMAPTARRRMCELLAWLDCPDLLDDVIAMLLAAELDPASRAMVCYLRGEPRATLSVGVLLLVIGVENRAQLLAALGTGAPARRFRLFDVIDRASEAFASATVRPSPRLLRWFASTGGLDNAIGSFVVLAEPAAARALPSAAATALEHPIESVSKFLANQPSGALLDLVLRGPNGSGRREVLIEVCRRLECPLLVVSTKSLREQIDPVEAASALLCEAALLRAHVLLENADELEASDDQTRRLRAVLATSPRPLVLSTSLHSQAGARKRIVIEIPVPPAHTRAELFEQLGLAPPLAEQAGSLYQIGIGAILRIHEASRVTSTIVGGETTAEQLAAMVRNEFEEDLGTIATRVEVTQTWNDIVLPEECGTTIRELVNQVRHRSTVLGRWGFQKKLSRGVGTIAMFCGQPGTGKSMVAGLVARELGLDLYQIDLARVMSKWVGETEKNLGKLFDAGEAGHALLLFDEADALLGKRTADVKSGGERFANMETNYILQRFEGFHGVAILTTNLESSIDTALSRRLSFKVEFPFPDKAQREEIWRRVIPAQVPIEPNVRFDVLAAELELSGGFIRNIALRAAFLAAEGNGRLTMQHFLQAATSEYRDRGKLVASGRLD